MCRLFGFRAGDACRVHQPLLHEKNALMHQSQQHPDGWGVAFYPDGEGPKVTRGAGAAFKDADFARVVDLVSSHCVLAHVRKASVGEAAVMNNSHPFRHGKWLLAHNGTVTDFDQHRVEIEALLPPDLRATLQGTTDSERCAALFAAELRARGNPDDPDYPIEAAADALRATVNAVRTRCDKPDKPSSLTFLVTNGRLMLACRLGRELHVTAPERTEHFMISSEKLSTEGAWAAVPDGSIVGVDKALRRFAATL